MSYFADKLLRVVRDVHRHMNARKKDEEDLETQLSREFPITTKFSPAKGRLREVPEAVNSGCAVQIF